ncbi:hypothetical protein V8E36_005202 [Tilletia maclaganii]
MMGGPSSQLHWQCADLMLSPLSERFVSSLLSCSTFIDASRSAEPNRPPLTARPTSLTTIVEAGIFTLATPSTSPFQQTSSMFSRTHKSNAEDSSSADKSGNGGRNTSSAPSEPEPTTAGPPHRRQRRVSQHQHRAGQLGGDSNHRHDELHVFRPQQRGNRGCHQATSWSSAMPLSRKCEQMKDIFEAEGSPHSTSFATICARRTLTIAAKRSDGTIGGGPCQTSSANWGRPCRTGSTTPPPSPKRGL